MMQVRTSGVIATLLLLLVYVYAQAAIKGPYDANLKDHIDYLLKYHQETGCNQIGVGDNRHYQKLLFYRSTVHAFGQEVCIDGLDLCTGCNKSVALSQNVPRSLHGNSPCITLADIDRVRNASAHRSTYVHLLSNADSTKLGDFFTDKQKFDFGPSTKPDPSQRSLLVWNSFIGNDLRGPWSAKLQFRKNGGPRRQILLTDECASTNESSIEIAVVGNILTLSLRFINDTQSVKDKGSCRLDLVPASDQLNKMSTSGEDRQGGWMTLMMESDEKGIVRVSLNNDECFKTTKSALLVTTQCSLYLGGSAIDKNGSTDFTGDVETFKFIKGPKSKCMQ